MVCNISIFHNIWENPSHSIIFDTFHRMVVAGPILHRCQAIHWLYGDGDYQLPQGCAVDPRRRLCLCGDWCYNGRVEGAFLILGPRKGSTDSTEGEGMDELMMVDIC